MEAYLSALNLDNGEKTLEEAAAAYRAALEVYTREQPEDHEWARQELEKRRQLQKQRGLTVQSE
ncbi:hypothetical protein F0U59_03545 [Archangium gephyra]|nr:hypothetical protein F0U59_03545 [Archangium gephyra]